MGLLLSAASTDLRPITVSQISSFVSLFFSDYTYNQNHMIFVFVWLLHLSMIISWSIHVAANGFLLFSGPVMSYSLQPHGLQYTRPPCPSPSPGIFPSSCSLNWWCCPAISSSDALFSFCPQSFPVSGTLPVSHLFASDDQNVRAQLQHLSMQWIFRVDLP